MTGSLSHLWIMPAGALNTLLLVIIVETLVNRIILELHKLDVATLDELLASKV